MRVLVTGSKGQVGFCLTQKLTGKVDLLALDRDQLDITNKDEVFKLVSEYKPDFIINAAAHTAVDKAEEQVEASYAINSDGPKFLAQAAKFVSATILHISTDYVYPGNKEGIYTEDDVTGPLSVYGTSKLAGELALVDANEKHIILRTAWVFGEHGNNFVKTMLRLGKDRDALSIVGDQYGGPTYAGDIADALIQIMHQLADIPDSKKYGVYHFSGEPHVSWFGFAKAIFTKAQDNGLLIAPSLTAITTADYPTPATRPKNSKLACTKIEKSFGIKPSDWKLELKNIKDYTE